MFLPTAHFYERQMKTKHCAIISTSRFIQNYCIKYWSFQFDRDVLLLQVVAALMDPNKFIIRVLDKFTLSKWAEIGFEDSSTPLSSASIPGTPSATPEELRFSNNISKLVCILFKL